MINTIDHIINIDLANRININKSIEIKKNDTDSHKFIVNIFNSGVNYDLTGTTAKIYFKKPDSEIVFLSCVYDEILNNKLSTILTTQALTSVGNVATEITIYGTSGEILTSVTFDFNVLENIRDDLAIESTSEFTALTDALAIVTNITLKADKTYVDSQDLLTSNKVGSLISLTTSNKTDLVNAINENVSALANNTQQLDDNKYATVYKNETIEPMITFIDDDGSSQVFTKFKPIFDLKNAPLCCAIITGYIDTQFYLTSTQLTALNDIGWEFLGHGVSYTSNLSEFPIDADLDYQLNEGCKQWLENKGFKTTGFVFPQGVSDERIRLFTRKYYDYSFAGDGINDDKIMDTMRIVRTAFGSDTTSNKTVNGNSEKNTLAYYKACVDYAKTNNAWLTFMTHCSAQDATQDAILPDLIDYIQASGVKIVTARDAHKVHANKVFSGDVLGGNYFIINKKAMTYSSTGVGEYAVTNGYSTTTPIGTFKFGLTICEVASNHPDIGLFPTPTVGIFLTYKTNATVAFQEYHVRNVLTAWKRTYNHVASSWGAWEKVIWSLTDLKPNFDYFINPTVNAYTNDTPISGFTSNKITCFYVNSSGSTGFPNDSSGTVTTYRFGGNGWDRQEFRKYNTDELWSRHTDSITGAWTIWVKISVV